MKLSALRPGMFLVLAGLAILGLVIYSGAVCHPFVHDDVVFIRLDPNIGRWDNLADAFLAPGVPFRSLGITTPYYRPLLEVLYRAQYALFGMHPWGFHLFNIILHIAASWLVFTALRFWGLGRLASSASALLFLVHPVQSEAVACVSGISNLAVGVLVLLSFVLYARSRMRRAPGGRMALAAAFLVFLGALLTKEQAVLLPVFLLVYELVRRKDRNIWQPAAFFVLAGGYFLWRGHLFPGHLGAVLSNPGELWLRILAIPRTLFMYLGLMVWPAGLHYYRSTDILAPSGWAWWLLAAAGTVCGYLFSVKHRRLPRPALLGLAWGFLFLLPAFNIVPLVNEYSLVLTSEHFLYLSLAGFLAVFASLSQGLLRTIARPVAVALFVGVALAFSVVTVRQNTYWRGEVPLFQRTLRFEPGLGRVHLLLARAYANERNFTGALEEYAKGLRIMEDYVRKSRHPAASLAYRQFIKGIYRDRGQIFMATGDLVRSSAEFRASLAVDIGGMDVRDTGIDDSQTASSLGMNALRLGRRAEARRWWQTAAVMSPRNAEALNNLGMMALERRDRPTALFLFQRSLRAAPGFVPAAQNLEKLGGSRR
ncbi:MAG: hypothetical protein HGA80_08405 [Candidatus Omnitrophica bacterium]|nr:hypothetical protein [Candidatus Omnitrophota bacterium]